MEIGKSAAKGVEGVVQGIEADNEIEATRILEHARPQLNPSQARDALFIVHPYFVQFTPELAPSKTEVRRVVMGLEARIKSWNHHRDEPDIQRELASARAYLAYIKKEGKVSDYLKRLESLVSSLDTSKVKLVLVEGFDDYWRQSARHVESGRFNSVLITKNGDGVLLESQGAAFTELLKGVKTAYVAGSYANQCPFTFAYAVKNAGASVVPVADLLFSYLIPPEMLPTTWRDKGLNVRRSARTYQLPKVTH